MTINRSMVLAGLLVGAAVTGIWAQQALRTVQFVAPFAFQVEGTKLMAGQYTILEQSGWIQIQNKDGKAVGHVLTMPKTSRGATSVDDSAVVFHQYGGRFFLAEVWAAGQERGRELIETREEQQAAKRDKMAEVRVPAKGVGAK